MSIQSLNWKLTINQNTGWEVLSLYGSGTYSRDFEDRYYYLSDALPTTWRQIVKSEDLAQLKKHFEQAHSAKHRPARAATSLARECFYEGLGR